MCYISYIIYNILYNINTNVACRTRGARIGSNQGSDEPSVGVRTRATRRVCAGVVRVRRERSRHGHGTECGRWLIWWSIVGRWVRLAAGANGWGLARTLRSYPSRWVESTLRTCVVLGRGFTHLWRYPRFARDSGRLAGYQP